MIMNGNEYLYKDFEKICIIDSVDSLEDKKWKPFRIDEIFQTYKGSNGIQTPTGAYVPKKNLFDGKTPRITVRDTNNGVDGFYNSNDKIKLKKSYI